MEHSHHYRAVCLAAVLVAAALVGGCRSDAPTGLSPERRVSLGLDAQQRGDLHSAISFAGEQPVLGLADGVPRDRLAAALAAVARQVERDDYRGVERAVAAAHLSIERYREIVEPEDPSSIELAALTFTLDRTLDVAREGAKGRGRSPTGNTSREDKRP